MIMHDDFKADLISNIQVMPDDLFTANGKTKEQILGDADTVEALWYHYQKSIEEFDVDAGYALRDALFEVCNIPMEVESPNSNVVLASVEEPTDGKAFLKIGGKNFSLAALYCALWDPACKPEYVTNEMLETAGFTPRNMMLCQKIRDGIIEATCAYSNEEYPCMELQFQPTDQAQDPILMVRAEQKAKGSVPPDVYLYGRGDSFIAKMPVDIRPEDDLGEGVLQTDLLVGGDFDNVVRVTMENQYVTL